MKVVWLSILLFAGLMLGMAIAQAPPMGQPTPSISDLDQQLQEVGCKAERNAAATTIVQMRAQIDQLQKQVNALKDPPKSGATKH